MSSTRKTALIAGALFVITFITSIPAALLVPRAGHRDDPGIRVGVVAWHLPHGQGIQAVSDPLRHHRRRRRGRACPGPCGVWELIPCQNPAQLGELVTRVCKPKDLGLRRASDRCRLVLPGKTTAPCRDLRRNAHRGSDLRGSISAVLIVSGHCPRSCARNVPWSGQLAEVRRADRAWPSGCELSAGSWSRSNGAGRCVCRRMVKAAMVR